jgi:hypothetical protein
LQRHSLVSCLRTSQTRHADTSVDAKAETKRRLREEQQAAKQSSREATKGEDDEEDEEGGDLEVEDEKNAEPDDENVEELSEFSFKPRDIDEATPTALQVLN